MHLAGFWFKLTWIEFTSGRLAIPGSGSSDATINELTTKEIAQ